MTDELYIPSAHNVVLAPCIHIQLYNNSFEPIFDHLIAEVGRSQEDFSHIRLKEPGTTELMNQSARGDVAQVATMLNNGATPNETNANGYTALMFAAEYGNLAIAKLLLESGADLEARNKYGYTALFVASVKGSMQPTGSLEELSYIGEQNHEGVMKFLSSQGASIFALSESTQDAEYTAKAFLGLAEIDEQEEQYSEAKDKYDVAMRHFILASELRMQKYELGEVLREEAEDEMARDKELAAAFIPALEGVRAAAKESQNNRLAKRLGEESALHEAGDNDLSHEETLELIHEKRNDSHNVADTFASADTTTHSLSTVHEPRIEGVKLNDSTWRGRVALIDSALKGDEESIARVEMTDIDLIRSNMDQQKAILVATILECYTHEIDDEGFSECLMWAKSDLARFEEETPQRLKKLFKRY